jgi:hypothetical protein
LSKFDCPKIAHPPLSASTLFLVMKKKSLSPTITVQDWLKVKPYKVPSAYDTYYIQLCREVYDVLSEYDDWLYEIEVENEEKKQLAVVLVSYYEDFISEVGIWKAFTEKNRELYGHYLPFYDLSDYDPDYLNPSDFAYLIWHFLTKYNEDATQAPDTDELMELAEQLYDLLEPRIEDSPATGVYDEWFNVPDQQNFFVLKERLHWLATKSYLMGTDFGPDLAAQAGEVLISGKFLPEHQGHVLYAISEPFVFTRRSSYSAMHAPEWFSRVARCSAPKREEINNLRYWHPGKYRLEGDYDKTFLRFTHLYTGQTYLVRRDSFQNSKKPGPDGTLFQMTLVKWNGDWWLSGMMYSLFDTEKDLEKYRKSTVDTPWILPEKSLEIAREATDEMYRNFVDYFGSPLALFKNKADLNQRTRAFMDYHAQTKGASPEKLAQLQKKFRESIGSTESTIDYSEGFKGAPDKDYGTFFAEEVGMITFQGVGKVIQLMQAPSLTQREKIDLFVSLTNGFQPVFARWLLGNYPTHNVGIPVQSEVDGLKNVEFFWRFYHPEEFDKTIVSTGNEEHPS